MADAIESAVFYRRAHPNRQAEKLGSISATSRSSKLADFLCERTNPAAQFDLFVYTLNADGSLGKLQAANFFAVDPDVVTINAVSGRYLLRVSPTIPLGDSYVGKATLEQKVGPATQGGISSPTFQNFQAPAGVGTDDPVQRGSICNSGTVICSHTPNDRNLLDFIDATLDRQGRVLVAYADGCTSPTCINAGPDNYTTNDYLQKATLARQLSGKGLFAVFDGFIGQNVTSLIALQTSNPRSGLGISSFDLALKNASSQSIFTPLTLAVNQLTSTSGKVSVNNADNGQTGAGASWSYSNTVGTDNILSAGETSGSRSLRFNNPGNEGFTVTFSVIGNLTQATPNSTSANRDSSAATNSSSSIDPGSSIQPALLSNVAIRVTYNPVLNTLTWQVLKQ